MRDGVFRSGCQMCHGGCGILVHVQNGKVVKVEGDTDCPTNRGWLCVKGHYSLSWQYNPRRLLYPLQRAGPRGEGKWRRIPWDEATQVIAEKLTSIRSEFGPEAVALSTGTRFADVGFVATLFGLNFGTPNVCGSGMAQCFLPRLEASVHTYGKYHFPDFEGNPQCIVMWGDQSNITSHNHYNPVRLGHALQKCAKLIVVDPRLTSLARRADIWLPIRPGTDAALALSWLNVIITGNLYDREFVEKWTNAPFLVRQDNNTLLVEADLRPGGSPSGYMIWDRKSRTAKRFDLAGTEPALEGKYEIGGILCRPVWQELMDRVQKFPPERAEQVTWIPADKIRDAARTYATIKPGALLWGVPIDMEVNSHQNTRALCLLQALSGNLDVPGGNVHLPPWPHWEGVQTRTPETMRLIPEGVWGKQLGTNVHRLLAKTATAHIPTLMEAVLRGKPYPVKALIVLGANPLVCWGDSKKAYETFKKVEFSVVSDFLMTPSAQLADMVLPAATFFEKDRVSQTMGGSGRAVIVQKVVEPLGECRDEFEFMGGVLRRCNLARRWPWETVAEFFDEKLKEGGLSWEQVRQQGLIMGPVSYKKYETDYYRDGGGFATPSGKVEIFSTKWRQAGYDPLPQFTEPPETYCSRPDLASEYPLIMISGRVSMYFHSQFREVPELRRMHPDPLVEIHPETAAKLGIADGDWVWIESPRGRCKQKAKLFAGMDPRIVHTEHNWWFPEQDGREPHLFGAFESNINVLTSSDPSLLDPGFGSCNLRNILCKVYKA